MGFLIGSRAHVRLTCFKPGRIVWKPANASPGLKFIQIITFSSLQMFFFLLLLLCFMFMKFKTENLIAKLQNLNRNFTFSWVSLIGFSTTWPDGATLLGWPKSIYYFSQVNNYNQMKTGSLFYLPGKKLQVARKNCSVERIFREVT